MNGLFKAEGLMLVQKKKNLMRDDQGKEDPNNYFYNLGFSNGTEVMLITSGKIGDNLELFKQYNLGLNFNNGKLKLVDYMEPVGAAGGKSK